jgi:hypothetical protein
MADTGGSGWRQPHRWVIVAVLVALVVTGLLTYRAAANNAEAQAKADHLVAELTAAGLRAPADKDTIVEALGDDGGPACDDPGAALRKALLDQQLTNGAAFVGLRPVIAARNLVKGQLVVLQVYCPEVLDDLRARIDEYKVDDVVKE